MAEHVWRPVDVDEQLLEMLDEKTRGEECSYRN